MINEGYVLDKDTFELRAILPNKKEETMNDQLTTNEADQTIRVSDEEFERLLATRPVAPEFDTDGNLVGYVTTDDEPEPETAAEPTKH
jgi:hypothetical protein